MISGHLKVDGLNRTNEERIEQYQRKKIPEGCKKTKVGVIPEEWEVVRIEDCLERVGTPVAVKPTTHYTQIGIRSHGKGLFYKEPITGEEIGNKAVFWIEPDCFILNIVFAWEQAIGRTTENERGMIGSHRFPMYRPKDNKVDIDYLIYYFLTKRGTEILEAASPGGAGRNRTLGQDRFMRSKIAIPPLEEQRKIVQILSEQDKVIELLDRKIEQLQQLKKYCLAKMFPQKGANVPEIRFPEFSGPWKQHNFSDFTWNAGKRNKDGLELEPFAITNEHGFIRQSAAHDDFGYMKGTDRRAYIIVAPNSFAYNPARINVGSIGYYEGSESVIVSSLYEVFQTADYIDDRFLWHWFHSEEFPKWIERLQEGSVRQYFYYDKLCECQMLIPSLTEQKRIAEAINEVDNHITLLQRKRDEEIKKKKALMQLLLTGIVRV